MVQILQWLVNLVVQLVTLLVIIQVFVSYLLSPYHPLRQSIDRIVEPLLRPIRKHIHPIGGLDFSPLVLLLLVQLVGKVFIGLLAYLNT